MGNRAISDARQAGVSQTGKVILLSLLVIIGISFLVYMLQHKELPLIGEGVLYPKPIQMHSSPIVHECSIDAGTAPPTCTNSTGITQPLINVMKTKGCIFNGLLSGTEDAQSYFDMLTHSQCQYLQRSIDTWNNPPNFSLIKQNMNKITNKNMIYGMFIAESINTNAKYYYPDEQRNFNFTLMCREGSLGSWGPNTCKPSFQNTEYKKYLTFITHQAIDAGIQDFDFGEVYMQDPQWSTKPLAGQIVNDMRNYASSKGKLITIGAQTNDISTSYLKTFDYIDGGVKLHHDGTIEYGPCFSEDTTYCHANIWNEKYAAKANNVIVGLDWSSGDDPIHRFVALSKEKRS